MNPLLLTAIGELAGRVFDRILPDKEKAQQAKLELLREAQSQEFQLTLEQIKINQEEAKHPSIFVAGWRPFIGWTCGLGLGWHFLGLPLANWAATLFRPGFQPPVIATDDLLELTLAMLGMAGLRAWEKYKGIARN